ncbi:lysine exporter LysO family protein [Gallaecimonas kandeliae]|uniref:lysine exporter LysO family protein n=1 Tax=Gallaecimonas kandeliae TaxID=3029055 RepID=UPI00264768F6|nr:lysine exporter LysO family protein [Gallaecimonas kandeliae]WKE64771.1 lysine exporter LysO family protein [Gallaecimonas kandeliae]
MFASLAVILLPLLLGYLLPPFKDKPLAWVGRGVTWLVYVILFFMGMGLAGIDNLASALARMAGTTALVFGAVTAANGLALWLLSKAFHDHGRQGERQPIRWGQVLKDSGILVGTVITGTLVGLVLPLNAHAFSEGALALLLLLIGIQLRAAGMTLRQLFLNRLGLFIALTLMLSTLAMGALLAPWLGLPVNHGMGLVSGFGWYSLSGILVSDALGPLWGATSFFVDLFRELVALALIPTLMQRAMPLAIGYAGATAMDFSLPVIQKSGGPACVPVAIVSGFLLSLATPVLMAILLV